jgi:hypothetical protein
VQVDGGLVLLGLDSQHRVHADVSQHLGNLQKGANKNSLLFLSIEY